MQEIIDKKLCKSILLLTVIIYNSAVYILFIITLWKKTSHV